MTAGWSVRRRNKLVGTANRCPVQGAIAEPIFSFQVYIYMYVGRHSYALVANSILFADSRSRVRQPNSSQVNIIPRFRKMVHPKALLVYAIN